MQNNAEPKLKAIASHAVNCPDISTICNGSDETDKRHDNLEVVTLEGDHDDDQEGRITEEGKFHLTANS